MDKRYSKTRLKTMTHLFTNEFKKIAQNLINIINKRFDEDSKVKLSPYNLVLMKGE